MSDNTLRFLPESSEKKGTWKSYVYSSSVYLLLEVLCKGAYNIDRGSENRPGGPN